VTFAASGWTEKQGVFALADEGAGGQIEDQAAIHLGVELEVEVVQSLVGIAELRLLCGAAPAGARCGRQFVGDQDGDQVDGRHVRLWALSRRVSSTAAMPLRRSCPGRD
jgi:hypothetical protein